MVSKPKLRLHAGKVSFSVEQTKLVHQFIAQSKLDRTREIIVFLSAHPRVGLAVIMIQDEYEEELRGGDGCDMFK